MIIFLIPITVIHILLFVVLFFKNDVAIYSFVVLAYLVLVLLYLFHKKLSNQITTHYLDEECGKCLKKYYIAISSPIVGKIMSGHILIFRILLFIWVPIMIYLEYYYCAVMAGLYWFAAGGISIRLDPINVLENAATKGNKAASKELFLIQKTILFRENWLEREE